MNTLFFLFEVATLTLPTSAISLLTAAAEKQNSNETSEVKTNLRGQAHPALLAAGVEVDLGFLNTSDLPDLSKKDSSALEDQVSDLFKMAELRKSMTREAFDATPMGSSVKKIYHLIENVMMPKVTEAHAANQKELFKLSAEVSKCGSTKNVQVSKANTIKALYVKFSPLHKTCRAGEDGVLREKNACWEEEADKKKIMDLKCKTFSMVSRQLGDQQAGRQIMKKGGSEATESYVNRVASTICGSCVGKGCSLHKSITSKDKPQKCGYDPYTCGCGFTCKFNKAKDACEQATADWKQHNKKCRVADKEYSDKRSECDSLQDQMDNSACKRAVGMKDACESYAECYVDRRSAYHSLEKMVRSEEKDRKAEWKGLKRMRCLIEAFAGGKVTNSEISNCKKKTHGTDHLIIKYPKIVAQVGCEVPHLYPNTPSYKAENFAPLPTLAKGKPDAYECTGLQEIETIPAIGSPKTCKCTRVTMNGPYSPGPVVKCVNCLDVRRSLEKNSCPEGTKLFSPRSRTDWKTFLASATPLRAPNWIVDITRPQRGCGGCKGAMNSKNPAQRSWVTSDASPWWLRATGYSEPNGDYQPNCYMDLGRHPFTNENRVTFNDHSCNSHAKSYYCQAADVNLHPKKGSPNGCVCKLVTLVGKYSAGSLMKCTGCLRVSRSMQKNSCPEGTKIFSPRTPQDWKTFIASAAPLKSPSWIIDVTQAQNGCGGCKTSPMNSRSPAQATWRTADGSPWFLRSSKYSEPNGDYHANCYLNLKAAVSPDAITFNDLSCKANSNAYYCQTVKPKPKPVVPEEPEEPEEPKEPPTPEAGGKYKGFKCARGAYTGAKESKECGHLVGLSESACVKACERDMSAGGKETCDKLTGKPACVASVFDRKRKTCMLYRECHSLVPWEGHSDIVTTLKATYIPSARPFQNFEDRACTGESYGGRQEPSQLTCWEACFENKLVGKGPVSKCAAMSYDIAKKQCNLFKACDTTVKKRGFVTFRKLSALATHAPCTCIPCGTKKPRFYGKGTCGTYTEKCSASSGDDNDGCYSSGSHKCDCKKLQLVKPPNKEKSKDEGDDDDDDDDDK